MSKLRPKVTLQIFTEDKCLGPGVVKLLELVEQNNSLRKASMTMGMAYSKAWRIIKHAEEGLGFPLLVSKIGGKEGGGAMLTEDAKKIIKDYRSYEKDLNGLSEKCFNKYFSWIK